MKIKEGDEVCVKEACTWSNPNQTLIVGKFDGSWVFCRRKGYSNALYPYHTNNIVLVSNNPFTRIKRAFKRAFEC